MEQIRLYECDNEKIVESIVEQNPGFDEIALEMVENNRIPGIVSKAEYDRGSGRLVYHVDGKHSLYEKIEQTKDWEEVKKMLIEICQDSIVDAIRDYLLFPNQLYYDAQYVFGGQGRWEYVYIPQKALNQRTLKVMLLQILQNNKWNVQENVEKFREIIQFLQGIQWFGESQNAQFCQMLEGMHVELPRPVQPQPMVEPQPQMQPQPQPQQPGNSGFVSFNSMQTPSMASQGMAAYTNTSMDDSSEVGETTMLGEPASAPMRPYLIRLRTNEKIEIVSPNFRLGKDIVNIDYTLKGNTAISRHHAVIVEKGNAYYIVDTNSKNHTYVEGRMIQPEREERITHRTKIRMADEDFEFYLY